MRSYLKEMRISKQLSQKVISEKAGISQSYYSEIENGHSQRNMTYSIMEKLSTAFEVPVQIIVDCESNYLRLPIRDRR